LRPNVQPHSRGLDKKRACNIDGPRINGINSNQSHSQTAPTGPRPYEAMTLPDRSYTPMRILQEDFSKCKSFFLPLPPAKAEQEMWRCELREVRPLCWGRALPDNRSPGRRYLKRTPIRPLQTESESAAPEELPDDYGSSSIFASRLRRRESP